MTFSSQVTMRGLNVAGRTGGFPPADAVAPALQRVQRAASAGEGHFFTHFVS